MPMTDLSKAVKAHVNTDITIDWWELGHVFAGAEHAYQGLFLVGAADGFGKFYKELQWEYIADWVKENTLGSDKDDIINMLEGLAMRIKGE